MKITLPEGFQMPASAKPGEPFEVVATLLADENGMVNMTALDGMALAEEMEEEDAEEEVYADPEVAIPFEAAPAPMV